MLLAGVESFALNYRIGANAGVRKRLRMIAEHSDSIHHYFSNIETIKSMLVHSNILDTTAAHDHSSTMMVSDAVFAAPPPAGSSLAAAPSASPSSPYTRVDNTGVIGGIADVIEKGIDKGHAILQNFGIQNSYGFSIILFTCLIKVATLPLTAAQLESTSKMQLIAPAQKVIQEKYADNEQAKNLLIAQLFQQANVNPLAGCFPALVQIPVFLSLYRALTNLIAQNKLDESFLWIPDLQGPVYANANGASNNWLSSIFTSGGAEPVLGWHDTLAFLTIPVILFISQTISQKALTPDRDPSKPMTEQEEMSQGVIKNLPFIVAFFSLNVPAGLGIYWISNNIITTAINISLKAKFADVGVPSGVKELLDQVNDGTVDIDSMMATSPTFPASNPFMNNNSAQDSASNIIDAEIIDDDSNSLADKDKDTDERINEIAASDGLSLKERADKAMADAIARAKEEKAR